ncbi:MAG: 30S ribosomal protein S20 [Candidatus Paceibacterota bacterium]
MPVRDSSKKAVRRDEGRTVVNNRRRRTMRKAIKQVDDLVRAEDLKAAAEALPTAYKAIDKAAKAGVIHANNAGRKKSRLQKLVDQK